MKTVIHVIDSLGIGGAETLMVHANVQLPGFNHIVVYLRPPFDYRKQLENTPTHCLNFKGWHSMPRCVLALRNLIKENKAGLVHSHLYYSTIIARMACPKDTTLISSYHNVLYDSKASNYSVLYRWVDRLTYQNRFNTLSVSNMVKRDLEKNIGIRQNSFVMYNYVEENYFDLEKPKNNGNVRLVSVGTLKPQKNYRWALETLAPWLKDNPGITWGIFGEGPERGALEEIIARNSLNNVHLFGKVKDIANALKSYQLFFMPSMWEGFGIALAEAMAAKLPCLVSRLPVFEEIAGDSVLYFDLYDEKSLLKQIDWALKHVSETEYLAEQASQKARTFTKKNYCKQLQSVYEG